MRGHTRKKRPTSVLVAKPFLVGKPSYSLTSTLDADHRQVTSSGATRSQHTILWPQSGGEDRRLDNHRLAVLHTSSKGRHQKYHVPRSAPSMKLVILASSHSILYTHDIHFQAFSRLSRHNIRSQASMLLQAARPFDDNIVVDPANRTTTMGPSPSSRRNS